MLLNRHNQSDQRDAAVKLVKLVNVATLLVFLHASRLIAFIPPNLSNTLRYRKTKNACEEWLSLRVSPECLKKIQALPYHRESIFQKIATVLEPENIEAPKNKFT